MMRDYVSVAERLASGGTRGDGIRATTDALWDELRDKNVSWVGFYVCAAEAAELVLEYCRDKPACSPIGLHGACGLCLTEKRPLLVRDVRALGDRYVACDPRDLSEVVLPCIGEDGACWGVLDLDSFEVGAFDESDVRGLSRVLSAAGLTSTASASAEALVL